MYPTNTERATWAGATVDTFANLTGLDDAAEADETRLSDLLTDLMHWADERGGQEFWDRCLARGRGHYLAEVEEAAETAEEATKAPAQAPPEEEMIGL